MRASAVGIEATTPGGGEATAMGVEATTVEVQGCKQHAMRVQAAMGGQATIPGVRGTNNGDRRNNGSKI